MVLGQMSAQIDPQISFGQLCPDKATRQNVRAWGIFWVKEQNYVSTGYLESINLVKNHTETHLFNQSAYRIRPNKSWG